jgi:hypothetical protein
MFHGAGFFDFLRMFRFNFHLHQTFFSTEKPFCSQALGKFQKTLGFFQRPVAKFSQSLDFFHPNLGQNKGGISLVRPTPHLCTTKIQHFRAKCKCDFTTINKLFHGNYGVL